MSEAYEPALVQHLSAPNDVSGNPRRVFVIYAADGMVLDAIDEGYVGRPAWTRDLADLPGFRITATEYKEILRNWKTKDGNTR